MSADISNLSLVEKRALLAQLLKEKANRPEAPSPLSYGQRAWWFLYQLEPENPAYNIMMPVRILSKVDTSVLRRAFERLVERHASLRMCYTMREGSLVQQVREAAGIDYEIVDASGWDERRLREAVSEEVHRPFDLECGLLLRTKLYTLSEHEHVLTMVVHHIAFDLWSLVLFVHELGVLYAAEKEGRRSPLVPLKYRYTDFVQRQLKTISGAEGERLWNYWGKQLSGELPVLNLPTYRTRPPVQTRRGAARRFTVSLKLSDGLKALSQANGATLYMTILAAYAVLLHRYSGESDIVVGSLAAVGRNHAEFSGLVGFFDNQIALRANLSQNPSFEHFLGQMRQTVLDALKHQDYPFPLLVERLQPERDTTHSPIFQTMFILQRAQMPEESDLLRLSLGMPDARVRLGELTLEPVDFERRAAGGIAGQLDLTLVAAELAGGLECSLQYNLDILDDETAEQMTRHFQRLLESIVAEPGRSVGTLPLLSEEERRRSVVDWNDTAVGNEFECLQLMFERQAARDPAATAAVFRGQRMTYGELNRRANKLAHYLRSLGVGPEVRVGICFERSQEMLVAVLGILKAGGAYVPLDPNYPAHRLAFMLEDACVRVLLTQRHLAERLPACGARVLRLDADRAEIERFDDANPPALTTVDNLAYIIYTSGSTGQPKGVMIDHRGAANTILDMNERYRVGPDERVLALSSLSFDLSVYDMLGTLAAGAAIVVPNPSSAPDPSDWLDLIERERVTVWNSAPALMEVFAEYVSGRSTSIPRSLRLVLMSGDWIPVKLPAQIKALAANEQLEVHSLGGATEASIWSITFPIKSVDPAWKSIPYGLPMVNQQFHVLDAFLQPAPVGVVGELYIGGLGVALGYHNRQRLTAEKFIPDQFSTRPGARLYRTGDLGRRLPDGNIEFLGRIDGQVKISGFRIELGEIETALGQHASVREAVVKTYVAASGEKRLAAYVVPKQESDFADDAGTEVASRVWSSLVELGAEPAARQSTLRLDESAFPALTECLNRLTLAYLCDTFSRLGVFTRAGEEHTLDGVVERCGCAALYRKAVRRWLELLTSQDLLQRSGESYVADAPLAGEAVAALWERLDALVADTRLRDSFDYFKTCGDNLADVLTGKLHPAQLLFKEGETAVAESFYGEGFRHCNTIARAVVKSVVRAWPRGRTLRVLEVGAGVGSTTAWLLPELSPQATAYAYTDISEYFLEVGRQHFGDYSFVSYGALDIERDPLAQGYEPYSFDLVIASSVLHATRDIKATLRHVRSLLAPRGLLLNIEETCFYNWFNVVGIQVGFDRFEDEALRREHPFLTEAQWERELRAHGFEAVAAFNRDRFTAEFLGLEVMVAQASPAASARIHKEELRDHLRGRLPEFMVPSAFVVLAELPLTPNGKVDQGALPAPEQAAFEGAEHSFVAPRNPTEEVLAGLWSQVLRRDRVGVEENFFEAGGDSLLATQLISRVRAVFNIELPLYCLFEAPTVAGLAAKIDALMSDGRTAACPPLRRVPRDGHLALSYAQQRLWFLDRLVPGNPFYNATAAVRLTGTLDRAALERSLDEVVRRHESLRTTFLEADGHAAQVIGDAWPINVRLVDFTGRAHAEQEKALQRLATEETQDPFDLILGPLMRVVLVRLGEREHVLLLTLHHIIFDGWSLGILLRDTAALYEAALAGKPSPLTELPVQYADFALWQREWLEGGVLEEQLGYWRRQLAGSTVLQLPTDRPRPASQTFCGARHLRLIPAELAAALKELSSRHDATFYMTLLAAFKILLHRYTGAEDVLVGSPIAGRTRAETEDLIGFFLNTLPMRTDLSGDPAFTELLGRVRETTLGAYAHQDVPFEKLVEELRPDRQITHTPFFRTWLVLQNAPMPPLELPGLSLSMMQVDDGTSKFDLVLSILDTAEGLHVTWIYNTDLFDAATVTRMAGHFETLLRSIVERPEAQLNALEIFTGAEKELRQREKNRREESNLKKLKSLRRSGVNLKQVSLTKTEYLAEGETLPLMLRPAAEVNLADWTRGNRDYVETELQRHGALLFRGFGLNSSERFEELALAVCPQLFTEYGDLPRQDAGSSRVYHSTPYPETSMILYHNESSHIHVWPLKIMFYCHTAALSGGETPIVDGRKVYCELDPAIRRRFEEKRLMYVRNYKEGLDVRWQSFFGTDDRATVEAYCRRAGIEYEWTADDGLRTRKMAPAVVRHPRTGELAFFNQMQAHHVSCLAPELRRSLLSLYAEEDLPRNVYYGDDTPIEDSVVDEVREVYRRAAVVFPWQGGDVLLVDNMLTAHARNPFVGPRTILVAMGDMISHEGY